MRSGKYPVARMENFKMKRSVAKWLMGLLCTLPVMYVWAKDARPLTHTLTTRELLGEVKVPKDFNVAIFARPPEVNYPTCVTAAVTGEVFIGIVPASGLRRLSYGQHDRSTERSVSRGHRDALPGPGTHRIDLEAQRKNRPGISDELV